MPVTRASAQPSLRIPLTTHKTNAGRSTPEIIVLSSDDEPTAPKKPPMKRQRVKGRTRDRSAAPFSQDIVEILSDDERPSASSSTDKTQLNTITALQKQLKEMQEELERHRAEARAREKAPAMNSGPLLNTLDDHITCEICTLKMWAPATLACGHTFCQSCLRDWFNAALAKHNAAHPQWRMREQMTAQYRAFLEDPRLHALERREYEAQFTATVAQLPRPDYTCPSCRAAVKAKPMEVYALKAMVNDVAKAMGESMPPNPVLQPAHRHRAHAGIRQEGPWDAFFL